MIALVFFLAIGSYLSFSLFGAWYPDHRELFYGSVTILAGLLLSQAWLFYLFFQSSAEEKLVFEKPLQKTAYLSMGIMSFLFTFTAIRDLLSLPLRYWRLQEVLFSPTVTTGIVILTILCFFWGMMNARFKISTPLIPIAIENLPDPLQGFRIVQLSDVHFGSGPDANQVKRLIDQVLTLKPDAVVLTGDIIDGAVSEIQTELSELSRLKPPFGSYFVLGNHECYWNHEAASAAIRACGVQVLLNEGIRFAHPGGEVYIAGVTDPALTHFGGKGPIIPEPPLDCALRILLAHQPQIATKVVEHPYHLQLSGHTHGGQFFPWNWIVNRIYRHPGGLNRLKDLWIYVSHGTGYWGPPLRLGTVGEITILEMVRAPIQP
jgi:hypothetical protein